MLCSAISLQPKPAPKSGLHYTDENVDSPVIRPKARLIRSGKFKGRHDTRGLRCTNTKCRLQGHASCAHCKCLPYVPSRLRKETRLHKQGEFAERLRPYRPRGEYWDNRMVSLLDELQKYTSEHQGDDEPCIKTQVVVRTQSLAKAREQINRITSKLWAKESKTA